MTLDWSIRQLAQYAYLRLNIIGRGPRFILLSSSWLLSLSLQQLSQHPPYSLLSFFSLCSSDIYIAELAYAS
jgi:hypothetical protein